MSLGTLDVIVFLCHGHMSQGTTDDLVHALRKASDVVRVQPRHRYPPVRRHVHMRPVDQRLRLLRAHPRKATTPLSTRTSTPVSQHT